MFVIGVHIHVLLAQQLTEGLAEAIDKSEADITPPELITEINTIWSVVRAAYDDRGGIVQSLLDKHGYKWTEKEKRSTANRIAFSLEQTHDTFLKHLTNKGDSFSVSIPVLLLHELVDPDNERFVRPPPATATVAARAAYNTWVQAIGLDPANLKHRAALDAFHRDLARGTIARKPKESLLDFYRRLPDTMATVRDAAVFLLSIPKSSAMVERVFSIKNNLEIDNRKLAKEDYTRDLLFLAANRKWLKAFIQMQMKGSTDLLAEMEALSRDPDSDDDEDTDSEAPATASVSGGAASGEAGSTASGTDMDGGDAHSGSGMGADEDDDE